MLQRAKNQGYTIYFVGGAGSIPARAAWLSFWKILEPYRHLIDYFRCCSGPNLIAAPASLGMPAFIIEKIFTRLKIRDAVEDIGFFAEHNQGKGIRGKIRDLWAYFTSGWFKATMTFWRHMVDHRVGIVRGENIKRLLEQNIGTAKFIDTNPKLEVVATEHGSAEPFIFSEEKTPNVPIHEAAVASCAIEHLFAIREIDGEHFVDAAAVESIPIESVIKTHIERGLDPRKLLIIGTFVHTLEKNNVFHFLARQKDSSSTTQKRLFELEKRLAVSEAGAKIMILEFNANQVILPPADPFSDLEELGKGFRFIRKLLALIFNREAHDKLLRGIAIHLYKEINMAHLKLYLEHFDKVIQNKIKRHLDLLNI